MLLEYHAMFAGEPPKKDTPPPAKVIFEVEAKTKTRSGLPASAAIPRTSSAGVSTSVR